jgi:diphthamide synthase (EF-2-diphthine--ammonia ligase)
LYDLRARQLREKYDYLILSYSGGADSHNVLMSFIKQGIHLDEIVVNTMEKGNKKSTSINNKNVQATNAAAEHELQTVPRLKEAAALIPRTKITICDLTDYLFDYLD